jgi:hypothetical protein
VGEPGRVLSPFQREIAQANRSPRTVDGGRVDVDLDGDWPADDPEGLPLLVLPVDEFNLYAFHAEGDLGVPPPTKGAEEGLQRQAMTSERPGKAAFRKYIPGSAAALAARVTYLSP